MTQPAFTLQNCQSILGAAHLISVEFPTGNSEVSEFLQAMREALSTLSIQQGHGVILSGPIPAWGVAMLVNQLSLKPCAWIACYTPKLGAFVIVGSQTPTAEIGTVQTFSFNASPQPCVTVAICGPPHSGKSVFIAAFYRAIQRLRSDNFVFLERANPDGEGMWYSESDPAIAQQLRQKAQFTASFVAAKQGYIACDSQHFRLVLVDMPGRIDQITEAILDKCTHGLIISRSPEESTKWQQVIAARRCDLLGVIDSCKIESTVQQSSTLAFSTVPLTGVLVGLEREGPAEPYQQAVDALAKWLTAHIDVLAQRAPLRPSVDPAGSC